MAPRRRGLLKYIILIPILWFVAVLTFSLRTDPAILSRSNRDIPINAVDRTVSEQSLIDRIKNVLQFKQQNHIDQDHPPEERIKAREQAEKMNAQVQVVAPEVNHDHSNPNRSGPGEMGNAVQINKDTLSEEERKKYDDGWKNNAFNQYASDMISIRRTLADVRDPE